MNKSDTLSLITTFIELCIFCINENGDIKKLIIFWKLGLFQRSGNQRI